MIIVAGNSRDARGGAHVRLSAWLLTGSVVAALAACSGGDGGTAPPDPSPTPLSPPQSPPPAPPPLPAPPAGQIIAAFRLYESARLHASLAASGLEDATIDFRTWSNGGCVDGGGLMQTRLDGVPVAVNTLLPSGSHTFEADFTECLVDGLVGKTLSGSSSAAYATSLAGLNEMTASVSARSLRGTLAAYRSDLYDVTADGSGTWSFTRTATGGSTTYAPAVGSRLTNNLTTQVATFGGGSFTRSYESPPSGWSASGRIEFNALAVAVNGTEYVLSGSLRSLYGFFAGRDSHEGEVRIMSDRAVVARIYGDANGALQVAILSPLIAF